MNPQDIYEELDYSLNVYDLRRKRLRTDLEEFKALGVDKVYFSGDFPAIFFKEVKEFNNQVLKEIAQAHHLIWNYRKVMFLFVISATEIRIYNCLKKPFNYISEEEKIGSKLKKIEIVSEDVQFLKIIKELFSRIAVDSGILWTTENKVREEINVQKRIDRYLVSSLLSAAREIRKTGLDEEVIHSLLMRSIFIMYLEDKGAAKETTLYTDINKNARSYLDILNSKSDTYELFKILEEHFNGNVFPISKVKERAVTNDHLRIIKKCLLDGDLSDDPKLFEWRLFRFNIIQIELLSEIYENFLDEFKSVKKEESGQYYTPPSLVELILNEKLKVKRQTDWNVKILDPACGSGIFLVESFNRLVKRWKNANKDHRINFRQLKKILGDNIFGIEYNKYAIRVTAFSLYLAMVEHLNPKTLWKNRNYRFPHLINDPQDTTLKKQGKNLYRADTIGEIDSDKFSKVDLVIGNPPFGSRIKLKSIKDFCKEYNYGQDMVVPFLRKAVEFTNTGSIALIFSTKVLTNTEGPFENFRKWLFNETYVEKVYNLSIFRKAPKTFGGQLFTSAVGPISIVFYNKVIPKKRSNTIEYWAPKTYVKNNLIEGVVIDSTDIKFLPRDECIKPDTKIWKIAMWGNFKDYEFIEDIKYNFNILKKVLRKHNFVFGVGLHKKESENNFELIKGKHLRTQSFDRFFVSGSSSSSFKREFRKIDKNLFKAPFLTIKESIKSDQKICATYFPYSTYYLEAIYGIYHKGKSEKLIKALVAFLNSNFVTYYMFLTSSTWGIERDRIKLNEILNIAVNEEIFTKYFETLSGITTKIYYLLEKNYPLSVSIHDYEIELNRIINEVMEIGERSQILIEDTIEYSIDLFNKGYKSNALKAIDIKSSYQYAEFLCRELNSFLGTELVPSADIVDLQGFHPLNMVIIKLGNDEQVITELSIDMFEKYLIEIDKYLLSKKSKNIYVKRHLTYYDGDIIYLIKPNQKRFWSRSAAINDSKEIISEILKMQ